MRGRKQEVTCFNCNKKIMARVADIKRGWGKFCSKSCKAKKQEARTGQYKRYLQGSSETLEEYHYEDYLNEIHPFSSERLGQD